MFNNCGWGCFHMAPESALPLRSKNGMIITRDPHHTSSVSSEEHERPVTKALKK